MRNAVLKLLKIGQNLKKADGYTLTNLLLVASFGILVAYAVGMFLIPQVGALVDYAVGMFLIP